MAVLFNVWCQSTSQGVDLKVIELGDPENIDKADGIPSPHFVDFFIVLSSQQWNAAANTVQL